MEDKRNFAANVETLILPDDRMTPESWLEQYKGSQGKGIYMVYNPGTEPTPLTLRIAGNGENGVIYNLTNGDECKIVGMTIGNTSLVGAYIEINGETGQVRLVSPTEDKLAFEMHDLGYIRLEPCTPFIRSVTMTYASGSNVITSEGVFTEDMVGQCCYLNGSWRVIMDFIDENSVTMDVTMDVSGTEDTQIVTMNKIVFTGFTLSKLEMDFAAKVR